MRGKNENLANDTMADYAAATAPNSPHGFGMPMLVNHKIPRHSTPDDVAFNDITSITSITAPNPNPHFDSVVQTAPATPAADLSAGVLPPSQSVGESTRQRRNTALWWLAPRAHWHRLLGWINRDRLLPHSCQQCQYCGIGGGHNAHLGYNAPTDRAHWVIPMPIDLSKAATLTEWLNPARSHP